MIGVNGHLCVIHIENEGHYSYEESKKEINLTVMETDKWRQKSLDFIRKVIGYDRFFIISSYCYNDVASSSLLAQ